MLLTYLKANHEIDVIDFLVIPEELDWENVGDDAIKEDDEAIESQ